MKTGILTFRRSCIVSLLVGTAALACLSIQAQAPKSTKIDSSASSKTNNLQTRIVTDESRNTAALLLTTALSQISVVPPKGWQVQNDPSGGVVKIVKPNDSTFITMSVEETSAEPEKMAFPRKSLSFMKGRPTTRISENAVAMRIGESEGGRGFDIEWKAPDGTAKVTRYAVIFFSEGFGYVECSIAADKEKAAAAFNDFSAFILSIRHAPLGAKIERAQSRPE